MASLLTPEVLVLFLYFVVPGFVLVKVYDLVVPTERRNFGDSFIDVVAYSFVILTVWFWPYILLVTNREIFAAWLYYILLFVLTLLIAFATPPFLAWRFYKSRTSGYLRNV